MDNKLLSKRIDNKSGNKEDNQIQKMNNNLRYICNLLMVDCTDFRYEDARKVIELIKQYISTYDRILYSFISNYIFSLSGEHGTFTTNLNLVAEIALSSKYEKEYIDILRKSKKYGVDTNKPNQLFIKEFLEEQNEKDFKENYNKLKKTILKIYDHSHLAINQWESLKQGDAEFKRNFIKNIEPVNRAVTTQLNKFTRSINAQLISLVGIFTAMSFLVFGGINSLAEILKNIKSIPILQAIIIGDLWGLCITNLIFVFMFFVSKMTDLNIKSCDSEDASLIKKYPLVFWSELIIITIFLTAVWIYYIDVKNIGGWFITIGLNHSMFVCITGIVMILIMFISCSIIITNNCNKKDTSNKQEKLEDEKSNKTNSKVEIQTNQEAAVTK